MDILSDVNLVGNLKVSKSLDVSNGLSVGGYFSGCNGRFKNNVEFSCGVRVVGQLTVEGVGLSFGSDYSQFGGVVKFSKTNGVFFMRQSVSGRSTEIFHPTEVWINVPCGCESFLIHTYADIGASTVLTSDNFSEFVNNDQNLIHPLITAWSCGKKIDMDIEIVADCGSSSMRFNELIIGKINKQTQERNIFISLY